jgi:DNA invertase Pin-like site-specific DNA recombinase
MKIRLYFNTRLDMVPCIEQGEVMKRAVLYLRVSTLDQTTANQERELRQVAERAGWQIVLVYKDHGISGAKGKDKRPQFDALHKAAARREFDVVMAWSVDRLGRSLQDLVGFLSEIHAAGVDLFLHQQGIDTTTPGGKAMFQMLGVFAEFERSIIQERVRAGLRRAKAEGKQLGRPRIAPALEAKIRAALKAPGRTEGVRKIAKAIWRRSGHGAADQPPFRGHKRRRIKRL